MTSCRENKIVLGAILLSAWIRTRLFLQCVYEDWLPVRTPESMLVKDLNLLESDEGV